jgi:hypothetical protein
VFLIATGNYAIVPEKQLKRAIYRRRIGVFWATHKDESETEKGLKTPSYRRRNGVFLSKPCNIQ